MNSTGLGAAASDIADLSQAIRAMSRANVLVVGDAMLDTYVYGDVERVSFEAPVPVLCVRRELAMPGGAGNIVRYLGALGAAVAFVSVVGDDQAGSDLTGLIGGQPGVEPWLLVQGGRITTRKTRFVARGQHLLRTDREETGPVHPKLAERLVRIARDAMAATSVTVLSDYRKGVLSGDIPAQLIAAARQAGRPIIAAVHGGDLERYAGADLLVVSRGTAARVTGLVVDGDAGTAEAAERLRAFGFGAVVIERAADGATLLDAAGVRHAPAWAADVYDVAGTADVTVATLAAAMAVGVAPLVAVQLAALAIGVVVGRVGMAVVREADLLAALAPEGGAGRKIVSRGQATERVERWRRQGWRTAFAEGAFDPLRPSHVHLLRQAREACDRLVVGLRSDALLRRHRGETRPNAPERERAADLAALGCVDLVVLHDDDTPTEMLRALRPEIVIGGADRSLEEIADAELVNGWGGKVIRTPLVAEEA